MLRRCLRRLAEQVERAVEEYDVLVIGGGPAGLAAAIRLKQLGKDAVRVAVVEKGAAIGAHILSGACIETAMFDEFLPDWKKESPIKQKVTGDAFYFLTEGSAFKAPFLPKGMQNHHNYIAPVGEVTAWMGTKAEELGVDIFAGFAGAVPTYNEKSGALEGVQLEDKGLDKAGKPTDQFTPGMILKAKQTIIAEGCRGSLTKMLEDHFKMRENNKFQTYALGVKELWEIPKENHRPGEITHTAGWPLSKSERHENTYGGTFMYEYGDQLLSFGIVVGLDYKNPYTRPFQELQKWKTHPMIRKKLEGGKPINYGARTLAEGGLVGQPNEFAFPGGMLVGDSAGFLNLPKIKGVHTAVKSGTLAAESIYEELFSKGAAPDYGVKVRSYESSFRRSWAFKELYEVRNVRQMFAISFLTGVMYTGMTSLITHGMEPWTLKFHHRDCETLKRADQVTPIKYPKPDGKLTFDLLSLHALSGTNHSHSQPSHLVLKDKNIPVEHNFRMYEGPEEKYCPAGVYEYVKQDDGKMELMVNAQNCLHCKACDIKDPKQNINWVPPEGSGGPMYNGQM